MATSGPAIRETVYKYLGCGDLRQGFARMRCRDCGHEYLLGFSCKGRYFCTSCHTKRAVTIAEWLQMTVFLPVPYRQIVLTIPKMLRIYLRYDRRLLGDLCRVTAGVIVESFRVLLALPQAQPGLVVCVHTNGNMANFHPHLHVMTGRENLARYLIRAPFSADKNTYNAAESTVVYETKRATGANGSYETFDPLDFLAAVTSHIPNRGEHPVRYYSYFSSVQRGRRRRQQLEKQPLGSMPIALSDDIGAAKTACSNWARFIKKIFGVDPLLCPDCEGVMKIISFIEYSIKP